MRRKRTEITIETERVLVVSRSNKLITWCGGCGAHVEMLTADEAALLAGVSTRAIFRWAEAGQIHFAETPEGLLLVCPNALPRKRDGDNA